MCLQLCASGNIGPRSQPRSTLRCKVLCVWIPSHVKSSVCWPSLEMMGAAAGASNTWPPPPPPHTHTEHNALALYLHATSCTWQRSSSNDKIRMFIYTAVKYLFGTPWSERPSLASHCGDGIGPSVYGSGLAEPQFCLLSLPGSDLTLVHGPPCPPPPPKCPQMPPNAKSALYPNCLPKDHGYDCYARQ